MTPEDWKRIKNNSVYVDYSTGKISAITVASLVSSIKAVRANSPTSISLLKYLYALLEIVQKSTTGADYPSMAETNSTEIARMLEEGLNPLTTAYSLKVVKGLMTVAGGAGAIASALLVAAGGAGTKMWFHDVSISLSTGQAGGGVGIYYKDDTAGNEVVEVNVCQYQPTVVNYPIHKLAAAENKGIYGGGNVNQWAACADGDTVNYTLRYAIIDV